MKLYNKPRNRYTVGMSATTPPLITRLRASSRLCIMVLALFILKIGMAHACANHDLAKELTGSAGSTQFDKTETNIGKKLTVDEDSSPQTKHAFGSCPDCNCHHAAAMLPVFPELTIYTTRTKYFSTAAFFQQFATRSNFRPPIL